MTLDWVSDLVVQQDRIWF